VFRPCVLIPTYDNPDTIRRVVEGVRAELPDVIVVDDGSHAPGREACAELARDGLAVVHHRSANGGKGAACKDGFHIAKELGFTHAFQIDGDGQHDLGAMPRFLELARANPTALICGKPVYDDTLHRGRYAARLVTRFWNAIETLGPKIADSMCGFRVYPLDAAIAANTRGDRMNFDIEIPVRLVWAGVPIINTPVGVRYLQPEEGGVSHYNVLDDTVRISFTHAGLVIEGMLRIVTWPVRRLVRRS